MVDGEQDRPAFGNGIVATPSASVLKRGSSSAFTGVRPSPRSTSAPASRWPRNNTRTRKFPRGRAAPF
jgi:hypothetical protein